MKHTSRLRQSVPSMTQATSSDVSTCPTLDQPEPQKLNLGFPFEVLEKKTFLSIVL